MLSMLERLEENITVLEGIHSALRETVDGLRKDTEWSIRYGLMESIQIVIDVSCHLCGKNNLGAPENYSDCVKKSVKFGYIPAELSPKLIAMIGLRNLLIHEYVSIDVERLVSFLNDLDIFRQFSAAVQPHL